MKPGYKTTEFWITAASQIVAILVAFGVLSSGDASTLTDAVTKIAGGVGVIAANAAIVWRYIASRTSLKEWDYLQ